MLVLGETAARRPRRLTSAGKAQGFSSVRIQHTPLNRSASNRQRRQFSFTARHSRPTFDRNFGGFSAEGFPMFDERITALPIPATANEVEWYVIQAGNELGP